MKVVLTIAGSDSSGGAGIQADLKTFEAFSVFGTSVLTVLTAQNTQGVTDIYPISVDFIKEQLKVIFDDFEVSAIKIGMLFSNEIIDVIREFVKDLDIPIVFDPVCISKAGSQLLNDNAVENLKSILNYSTIATPNQFEATKLFGNIHEETQFPCPIVIKDVNLSNHSSIDKLYIENNIYEFELPSVNTRNTHGTGCSFSSAIAANLALGKDIQTAVQIAKEFVYQAIIHAPDLGKGKGPINHKEGAIKCQIN